MILSSHGIIASQIASFDADAVAFFNRVTTAGGTLSTTEKQAVNQLVLDLKANSLWTPMKAIYPMVGASAAACAQNLKSSSFTGTFTSGWTFASTGVTPNGTSAFFDTGLIPSTQLSANSTAVSYYSRTNTTTNNGVEIGTWNTAYTNGIEFYIYRNSGFLTQKTGATINQTTIVGRVDAGNQNSQAFFTASRIANNNLFMQRNGSPIGTSTVTATTSLSAFSIYLGASNAFGTAEAFSNKQCAFAHVGDGLTDTQASNFYTAVQAFQTTLSRQV
jgi:hypothetical protein